MAQQSYPRAIEQAVEGCKQLVVWAPAGRLTAFYVKRGGKWRMTTASPQLEFLRYCGKAEDARRALEKRRLTWKWFDSI